MKRLPSLILLALSLLLSLASLSLWIRSHWIRDIVGFGRAGGNCHIAQSISGRLHLLSNLNGGCSGGFSHTSDSLAKSPLWNGGMSSYPAKPRWRYGFILQTYTTYRLPLNFSNPTGPSAGLTTNHRLIVIPWWFPTTLFTLPALPLAYRLLRPRPKPGHCPHCHYDLRASPSRCPECGHTPTRA